MTTTTQDQDQQAAMKHLMDAAQGVADSLHAVGADRNGFVHWEVNATKMRDLHIALANCRALDATTREASDAHE